MMWESYTCFWDTLSQARGSQPRALTLEELQRKMVNLSRHFSGWENLTFGNVKRELKGIKEELEWLRSDPLRRGPSYEEIKIVDRLLELNHHKQIM